VILKLSNSEVTFIQQLPVCRLATVTPEGQPIVRPVWHVFDGETVYFATDPGLPKLIHIRGNPKVSLAFDDYDRENWSNLRGIRIEGEAAVLEDGEEYRYAHAMLKDKYPEYRTKEGGWEEGQIPIIKIQSTHAMKWANGEWKKTAIQKAF
jgi:nitroimidazol reductase NimA-like FMN-containing flavoprotein (pyridoxamine 5'-phosphate oxidase superfamily)